MAKEKHDHPACEAGPHVHEKVPVSGSAGGEITEGCIDHYDERIVGVDIPTADDSISVEEWRKYFVMGEILGEPRCKANLRRKFAVKSEE